MDSIQTQTFAIRGNDDAVAYIDFVMEIYVFLL